MPSKAIYKLNNLTSTFTKTYNHTRCTFHARLQACATAAPHKDGPLHHVIISPARLQDSKSVYIPQTLSARLRSNQSYVCEPAMLALTAEPIAETS